VRWRPLLERGLPVGRANAWVELPGRWIRGDHVYERERVIVELDGAAHGTMLRHERDEVEADLLRLLGSPPPTP
jgi:hypothetical protein